MLNTLFIEANDTYDRQVVAQIVARYALAHHRNQARIIITVFEQGQHKRSQRVVSVRDRDNPAALQAQPFNTVDELRDIIQRELQPVQATLARKSRSDSPFERGYVALRNFFTGNAATTG